MRRGEEEGDAGLAEHAGLPRGVDVDGDAERLDDVGAAAPARDRAVAVLGDGHAARRDHDRRGGREVQRVRAVAARAASVDDAREAVVDRRHPGAHRLGGGDDHLRGLAPHAERDGEGADLHRRPQPVKDGVEGRADLRGRQRASCEERAEDRREGERRFAHDARPRRRSQLPRSLLPSVVRMLSGWNCTPSTSSVRCRSPMISPSRVHALTTRSSGRPSRATRREW